MTQKQESYINFLIDEMGYRYSPLKADFINTLKLDEADSDIASKIIDNLLRQIEKRNKASSIQTEIGKIISVFDLSQFGFCSANYSIGKSFILSENGKNFEYSLGYNSYFLLLLDRMKVRKVRSNYLLPCFKDFDYLVDSKIIFYRPHQLENKYFYNSVHSISGKPYLILESVSGVRTLIIEKIAKEEVDSCNLRDNHMIQAIAYLTFFSELRCSNAHVIYWEKPNNIFNLENVPYKKFTIEHCDENKLLLFRNLDMLRKMIDGDTIDFDINSIDTNKCVTCRSFSVCDHKKGSLEVVTLPYMGSTVRRKTRPT